MNNEIKMYAQMMCACWVKNYFFVFEFQQTTKIPDRYLENKSAKL